MPSQQILQLKDVSYRFPTAKDWVLNKVSFSVNKGEFVALVGPSGSGKTTLLLLARGFHKELGGDFRGSDYSASCFSCFDRACN